MTDDSTRYRGFKSGRYWNDNYLPEGWYAFITGKQMSTYCCNQGGGNRNTYNQGWLTESHPTVNDGMSASAIAAIMDIINVYIIFT